MKVLYLFIITKISSFAICQIKCETDFVAKNEDFLSFANDITKSIFENNDISDQEPQMIYQIFKLVKKI